MKTEAPLTFIIPCYGRQQKLERAIASVLDQDVDVAEIIIVDDASPEPLTIPEDLARAGRIRLIRHDRNGGPAQARNTGLHAARTDWVSFLDSDDRLLPGTLARRWEQAQAREATATHKGNQIYGCGWQDITPQGQVLRQRIPLPPATPGDFFRGCWFCPGSCVILNRVAVLERAGPIDATLRRLEDYEWYARIGHTGFELQVAELIGVAVERGNNTSLAIVTQAACQIRARIRHLTDDPRLQRNAESYLLYEQAAAAWNEARYARFTVLMTRSLLTRPRLKLSPLPGWRVSPPVR